MTAADVLAGRALWSVEEADCLPWLSALPEKSISLVVGSPPYEDQRTYGIGFSLKGQAWVDWMVEVVRAACRACAGLVCFVVEGKTKNYRWSATPALLMADLHRAGFNLRKPPAYRRSGIPGSGGPDWLRNDWELCVCVTPPGRLSWSDNTACGHPPLYGPGGAMSHRMKDGARVNQWGRPGGPRGMGNKDRDGETENTARPSHRTMTITRSREGQHAQTNGYGPPVLANPGNFLDCSEETFDALWEAFVSWSMTPEASSVIECGAAGGGHMGSKLAHESEAPFPEKLADFFVRSFCPPDAVVADCFSGSGTTAVAALKAGRRFVGCDLRASQVDLTGRRVDEALAPPQKKVTPVAEPGKGLFDDAGGD